MPLRQTKNKTAAGLALSGWLATIAFISFGLLIPDAWWSAIGSITIYFFVKAGTDK